jgi:pantoate kinase
MKAVAFAPGHISGFFEPVYINQDLTKTGSRGAGINVSLGAVSEVVAESATKQDFKIFVNDEKSDAPVTKLALKYLTNTCCCKNKAGITCWSGFWYECSRCP